MTELAGLINSLPSLRDTVEARGLMAKKALGQNFLLDANITDKIINLSLSAQKKASYADDYVYEIGPGPGGLTRAVLKHDPKKLTVIEMDERCIAIMEEIQNKIGSRLEMPAEANGRWCEVLISKVRVLGLPLHSETELAIVHLIARIHERDTHAAQRISAPHPGPWPGPSGAIVPHDGVEVLNRLHFRLLILSMPDGRGRGRRGRSQSSRRRKYRLRASPGDNAGYEHSGGCQESERESREGVS